MNTTVDKTEEEPILTRIIKFVESKGGIREVSGRINWNYQTINSIFKRGSSPKCDLLRDLARNYPDFDLNYIVTGQSKNNDSRIAELESDLALFKTLLKNTVAGKQ